LNGRMPCCDILKGIYCTRCYTVSSRKLLPFGFCKKCWAKQGKPTGMGVEDYIEEGEPANN